MQHPPPKTISIIRMDHSQRSRLSRKDLRSLPRAVEIVTRGSTKAAATTLNSPSIISERRGMNPHVWRRRIGCKNGDGSHSERLHFQDGLIWKQTSA